MFLLNSVLIDILREATEEELIVLTSIIEERKVTKAMSISNLIDEISSIGRHSFVNLFRGKGTGYLDILDDVADELKIKGIPSYYNKVRYYDEVDCLRYKKEKAKILGIKYAEDVEEKIILKLLELSYEKMTNEEKKSFDEQINEVTKKFDSNSTTYLTGGAGLLVLAKIGGFATYTFLTSSLSILSAGSLGFATYTGATTLLSVILSPVGWTALGAITVLTIASPNTKKLIPIIANIGVIRQRIKYDLVL